MNERLHPPDTMRFGSTAKVLAECKLKYYKISRVPEWAVYTEGHGEHHQSPQVGLTAKEWHAA